MEHYESVTQIMLLGTHRFSDYRTVEFPLYSDSHLSKEGEKTLLVMEEKKRNMRKNKVQMKAANT